LLKTKLSILLEILFCFINSKSTKNVQNLLKSNVFFSIIRSPFVYKKSMEQFFYVTHKLCYQTQAINYNFFLQKYQSIFLKKELNTKGILKFFHKIIFFFDEIPKKN